MDGGEADTGRGCGAGSANASCAREVAGVRREQYSTRCCRYSSVAWAPHIHVALRRGASPSRAHALGDAREVRSDTPDRARLFPLFSPRCPCPTVRPCTRAEPAKIFRAARGSIIRERSGAGVQPGVVQPSRTWQRMNRRGDPGRKRRASSSLRPPSPRRGSGRALDHASTPRRATPYGSGSQRPCPGPDRGYQAADLAEAWQGL
jgi:hypothetical protein